MPASARAPTEAVAPGFAELHGGDASVVLVPALGGKIRDITLAGRQWLWHNPDVPFRAGAEGASFAEAGNSGGFDDCLPTASECLIPSWVQGARSRQLADHGELWSQQPHLSVTAGERGPAATCTWTGTALPYRFSRTVAVRTDGSLEFTYSLTNAGTHRMPFVWASHPVLPLTEHTRIVLPEGARTRVGDQHGITIGRAGAEHRWPRLRVGSSLIDVSRPAMSQREDFVCKLFVDLPKADVVIALEEDRVRLEMHVSGNSLRHVGLRIDRRGWSPAAARRWSVPLLPLKTARPHANVVFGPCVGAPDSLSDALGAWDDARWIEAGATERWSMVWRGVRIEPPSGA
jgi:hypothetical protein